MGVEIQIAGFQRPLGASDTIKDLRALWHGATNIYYSAPKYRTLSQNEQDIEDKEWMAKKTGVYNLAYWHYDFGIHHAVAHRFLGKYEQTLIELTIGMLDEIVDDCINQTDVNPKGPLWGPFLEDQMLEYIKPLERVRNFLLKPIENKVRRVLYWTH